MPSHNQITYISRHQIDDVKWDQCIDKAANGLVYGYTVYLDHMAAHWDGLVLNDYQAVMPVTWNRKYGFYYIYQPFLSASLGVFGNNLDAALVGQFLQAVPRRFRLWELSLNHGNLFSVKPFNLFERVNYVLPLNKEYAELYQGFRENVKRNVRKADKLGCLVSRNFDPGKVIELAAVQMQAFAKVKDNDYMQFLKLYNHFHARGKAVTYGITDQRQSLLSSAIFFYSHNRAYYILVGNHPNGKTLGAGHALIDAFIRDHAGKDMLLDFEGSDIGNIAFFYSSFGAVQEKYPAIVYNRLPAIVRFLKGNLD